MRIISRRGFLAAAVIGGGMVWGRLKQASAEDAAHGSEENPFDAWVHIGDDGRTEIVLNKTEMGQGVFTSLPMIIAEEADLDWERVSVKQGLHPTGTGGSGSVRDNYEAYRQIGATIRHAMIGAASQGVGFAANRNVRHREARLFTIDWAERSHMPNLVHTARTLPLLDAKAVTLKDSKDFVLIGKARHHLDIPAKVQGKARFGLDVRLPGMVYAVVAQCPALDGSLVRFDASKAKSIPDVIDVFEIPAPKTGGEIAVVARTTWAAIQGRKALDIEWRAGEHKEESTASLRTQFL